MKRKNIFLIIFLLAVVAFSLLAGGLLTTQKPASVDSSCPAQEGIESPVVEPEQMPEKTPVTTQISLPEAEQPEKLETSEEPTAQKEPTLTPATEAPSQEELTCTLSVRCDDVLLHIDKLAEEKQSIIPDNGIMFPEQTVSFSEGESVFDVLLRELKNSKIHLEFVNNPMYNSAYIEGIGNLYEFDCGDTSGWMYKVNGIEPRYGCSQYKLKNGDKIEFFYRCSMFN